MVYVFTSTTTTTTPVPTTAAAPAALPEANVTTVARTAAATPDVAQHVGTLTKEVVLPVSRAN